MGKQAFELLDIESGYKYTLETLSDILPSDFTLILQDKSGTIALVKDVEDLSGKLFGVVGSGDKEYGEYYCQSARDFVEQFKKTGAIQGAELVCIENNAEDEDIDLLQTFVEELKSNLA